MSRSERPANVVPNDTQNRASESESPECNAMNAGIGCKGLLRGTLNPYLE